MFEYVFVFFGAFIVMNIFGFGYFWILYKESPKDLDSLDRGGIFFLTVISSVIFATMAFCYDSELEKKEAEKEKKYQEYLMQ